MSSVESVRADVWLKGAVKVATCRVGTHPAACLAIGDLLGATLRNLCMSGKRGAMRGTSERGGCEFEILREKRLSEGREQQCNSRMVWHGSGWC